MRIARYISDAQLYEYTEFRRQGDKKNFKAKCLGILEEVRKTRKPIRVTRFGKPVAEVIPPISRRGNRKAARIHGRNRKNPRRHRWTHRQLGRLGSLAVKLLLDTHIWLWSTLEPQRLTRRVDKALADSANELWLSRISVGELIVLHRKGCLELPQDVRAWVAKTMEDLQLIEAPLTVEVALAASSINLSHGDPADHFLAATAKVFELTLVTADAHLIHLPRNPCISTESTPSRSVPSSAPHPCSAGPGDCAGSPRPSALHLALRPLRRRSCACR